MAANAAREDENERLAPFMHACSDIVKALGPDAPELLGDLPAAVAAVVEERAELRVATKDSWYEDIRPLLQAALKWATAHEEYAALLKRGAVDHDDPAIFTHAAATATLRHEVDMYLERRGI
jgi:hypothetical protein